jgi:hypothetical protein
MEVIVLVRVRKLEFVLSTSSLEIVVRVVRAFKILEEFSLCVNSQCLSKESRCIKVRPAISKLLSKVARECRSKV